MLYWGLLALATGLGLPIAVIGAGLGQGRAIAAAAALHPAGAGAAWRHPTLGPLGGAAAQTVGEQRRAIELPAPKLLLPVCVRPDAANPVVG